MDYRTRNSPNTIPRYGGGRKFCGPQHIGTTCLNWIPTLAYYPPYHSKYNPIERLWGILENHWNGEVLDTEEKILGHLKNDRKDKATIIIANRISTIQNADRIIVLDKGKIVEKGIHSELLKNQKLYHSLYQKQLLEKEL